MKIVKNNQLKIVIFTAMKNRCILHGHVFVMICQHHNCNLSFIVCNLHSHQIGNMSKLYNTYSIIYFHFIFILSVAMDTWANQMKLLFFSFVNIQQLFPKF